MKFVFHVECLFMRATPIFFSPVIFPSLLCFSSVVESVFHKKLKGFPCSPSRTHTFYVAQVITFIRSQQLTDEDSFLLTLKSMDVLSIFSPSFAHHHANSLRVVIFIWLLFLRFFFPFQIFFNSFVPRSHSLMTLFLSHFSAFVIVFFHCLLITFLFRLNFILSFFLQMLMRSFLFSLRLFFFLLTVLALFLA